MMKGVSPVVATVLLIAIAVVAAVAVWFWVGAMGRPAVPSQEVKTFIVENCIPDGTGSNNVVNGTYNNTQYKSTLRLYNNGALTITGASANLYSATLSLLSYGGAVPTMTPGQRGTINVTSTNDTGGANLAVGNTYYLEYPGIPLVKFGC